MAEIEHGSWGRGGSLAFATFMAAVIVLLAGLGTWQVQRGAWKAALLAELDARGAAAPFDLAAALEAPPETLRYRRVAAEGRFLDRLVQLHQVQDGVLGYKAVLPFAISGRETVLLVDVGFVGAEMGGRPAIALPDGPVGVSGFARFHEARPSVFTPDNVPEANRWFWWDRPAMLTALDLSEPAVPALVLQLSAPVPGLAIDGIVPAASESLPRPHNRHGGYAVTWYGLALAVAGALLAWVRQRRRRPMNRPQSQAS